MRKLLEEINQILEKLEFKVRLESSTELRRFISEFNRFIINEIVIGEATSSRALEFIELINDNTVIFIKLIKKFHKFLLTLEDQWRNSILSEMGYALWEIKDIFFDKENFNFVKFIIKTMPIILWNAEDPDYIMYYYLMYLGYFHEGSTRDYSQILSLEGLMNNLDQLWKKYYKNEKWGHCSNYAPSTNLFYDNTGPLGILADLRHFLRKELNLFDNIDSEFKFMRSQILDIIIYNHSLVGIYVFYNFYLNLKYSSNEKLSSEILIKFKALTKELDEVLEKEKSHNIITLSKFYRWALFITKDKNYINKQNDSWKTWIQYLYNLKNRVKKYFTSEHIEKLEENNIFLDKVLELFQNDKRNFKIIKKIIWDLCDFYEEMDWLSWSIKMIMDLKNLTTKKKRLYLKRKRQKIYEKTVKEYELREREDYSFNIEGEYYLYKKNILFYLDFFYLRKYVPDCEKVNYLSNIIKQVKNAIGNEFFLELYYKVRVKFAVETDYQDKVIIFLDEIINFYKNSKFKTTEELYHRITKDAIILIHKLIKDKRISIEEEKEIFNNKVAQFFQKEVRHFTFNKNDIQRNIEDLFIYFKILNSIFNLITVLENWEKIIIIGSNSIPSKWESIKKSAPQYFLQIEIMLIQYRHSSFLIHNIIVIKNIFSFFYEIGFLYEQYNSRKIKTIQSLSKKQILLYLEYVNDSNLFSKLLVFKKLEEKKDFSITSLKFFPKAILLDSFYTRDMTLQIVCIKRFYNKENETLTLKFQINKNILKEVIPNYFFRHKSKIYKKKWINENLEFGIIWIQSDYPIKTQTLSWSEVKKIENYYEISITLINCKRSRFGSHIKPFIRNKNSSKRVYGHIKIIPNTTTKEEGISKIFSMFLETNNELERYENILEICHNFSIGAERLAISDKKSGEIVIRNILITLLNAIFDGNVTGETFNKKGKTDLLIRIDNKNIFIIECKVWRGPKTLIKAKDQLFNYIPYEDTKAAIFLFSKRKDFSKVLNKIEVIT